MLMREKTTETRADFFQFYFAIPKISFVALFLLKITNLTID